MQNEQPEQQVTLEKTKELESQDNMASEQLKPESKEVDSEHDVADVTGIFDTPLGNGVCASKIDTKLVIKVPLDTGNDDDDRIVTCIIDPEDAVRLKLLNPPDALRLIQSSICLELASDMPEEHLDTAISLYKAAMEYVNYSQLKPEHSEEGQLIIIAALTNLCKIYIMQYKYEEALEASSIICRVRPDYVLGAVYRAISLSSLNRVDEAISFIKTIQTKFPKEPRFATLLDQLYNIKKDLDLAKQNTAMKETKQQDSAFNDIFSSSNTTTKPETQKETSSTEKTTTETSDTETVSKTTSIVIATVLGVGIGALLLFMRMKKH